jgi:hypothetical protein
LVKPKNTKYLSTFTYNYDWYAYFCTIYNILHKIIYDSVDDFNMMSYNNQNIAISNRNANHNYEVINPAIYLNLSVFRKWPTLYNLLALLMELDLQVFFTGKDTLDMNVYNRLYTLLREPGELIDKYTGFARGINLYYPGKPIDITPARYGDKCYYIIEQRKYKFAKNARPICYPDFAGLIAELYWPTLMLYNVNNGNQANNTRRSSSMTKKTSSAIIRTPNKHNSTSRLASQAESVTLTVNPGYIESHSNNNVKYSQ